MAPASAAASPASEKPVVPAGAQPASPESPGLSRPAAGARLDESAARDERAAINRSLLIVQDHLAELDARLARLEPRLRARSLARTGLRGLAKILRLPLKLADARFRSERLAVVRKVNVAAFAWVRVRGRRNNLF